MTAVGGFQHTNVLLAFHLVKLYLRSRGTIHDSKGRQRINNIFHSFQVTRHWIQKCCYLDRWHKSKISNEDDAQLCGHVLHDRPTLITEACVGKHHESCYTCHHHVTYLESYFGVLFFLTESR